MHYVIYGAGGIGGVVGARLYQAGFATTLIARGKHGRLLAERGLRLVAPDGESTLSIPAVTHPGELEFSADTVVILCMKSQHTLAALEDLAASAPPNVAIVCMQNGVANEPLALRFFPRVYASVVNLPAMFVTPGEVVTHAAGHGGILDTGCYPHGLDETARQINTDLSAAGFSARPTARVMRSKYAKLLLNLSNILQAGLVDFEVAKPVRDLLRSEALACYTEAGIDCADKAETDARADGVYRMVDLPGYERTAGSSWQSMARGTGDIETEYLNGEICWLGRLHNVPTPANAACVEMARALVRRGAGPGLCTTAEFMQTIDKGSSEFIVEKPALNT